MKLDDLNKRIQDELRKPSKVSINTKSNHVEKSLKIEKVGGVAKGKRLVKNRQKIEATENQMVFKIDRRDKQRENRRKKRKRYAY